MNTPATPPAAVRSPSYPNMALDDAISLVAKIEKLYRQSPVDREVAAKLIGYSSLSGPAAKSLAALASYGLVERAGKGEMRVTARARAILHPDNLQERRDGLVAAAFDPSLFHQLRERWPDMIPPEDGIMTYLNRQGFNQSAIRPAMRAYRDTLLFLEQEGAHDGQSDTPTDKSESATMQSDTSATQGKPRVGDLVEIEIGGVLMPPNPARVRALSEDQAWVFVDGEVAGIAIENVTVIERSIEEPATTKAPPTLPLTDPNPDPQQGAPAGYRSETFDSDEGEIRITWPSNLSPQSVEDMKDWLELLKRRIARRAGAGEASGSD